MPLISSPEQAHIIALFLKVFIQLVVLSVIFGMLGILRHQHREINLFAGTYITITAITLSLFYRHGEAYSARRVSTVYILLMFITTCVYFSSVVYQWHSSFVTTEEDLLFGKQDHDIVVTINAVGYASGLIQFLLSDGIAVSQT
jgi:hypothetical protein